MHIGSHLTNRPSESTVIHEIFRELDVGSTVPQREGFLPSVSGMKTSYLFTHVKTSSLT